jgi:2'-5' RNA ligase
MMKARNASVVTAESSSEVPTKLRCFVAIDLAEEVRQRLIALLEDLAQCGADVRWVRPQGLHVTLKFLGWVKAAQLSSIQAAVKRVVAGRTPWEIELRELAAFPNLRRPRVLWVGVQDRGELQAVAEALEREFAALGFPRETRPYTPHVTLGRVSSLRGWDKLEERLKSHLANSWGESQVKTIIVYQSELRPDGAVYTPLWKTSLEENRGET